MVHFYKFKIFCTKLLIFLAFVCLSVALTYVFVFPEYSYVMGCISPIFLSMILIMIIVWELKFSTSSAENFRWGLAYHSCCAVIVFILALAKDVLCGYPVSTDVIVMFGDDYISGWQWIFLYLMYFARVLLQFVPRKTLKLWVR